MSEKLPNILIVTPFYYEPPNKKIGLLEISRALSQKTKVVVVSTQTEGSLNYEVHGNLIIYRFKPLLYFKSIPYVVVGILFLYKLVKIIKKEKIDIILAITTEFPTTLMAAIAKILAHKPLLVWIHGKSTTTGRPLIDLIKWLYDTTFGRLSVKISDKVLCLTESLKERAYELGATKDKIVIIPNGIDTTKFRPGIDVSHLREEFGIDKNEKVVTFVGRLYPIKGVEYFIKAGKEILKNYPNVKFLIVGEGPQEDYLKKLAETISPKSYIFTRFRRDIPEIMNLTDVLVLPSLSEGLPQVILEAYACGVPVIATDVGGVADILKNGANGYLVQPRNYHQIAVSVLNILENRNLAKKISRNNINLIRKKYDIHCIAIDLLNLLVKFCSK